MTKPKTARRTRFAEEFTCASVRQLVMGVISPKGPHSSLRLPSKAALDKLARNLNEYRLLYRTFKGPIEKHKAIVEEIAPALEVLAKTLPLLRVGLVRDMGADVADDTALGLQHDLAILEELAVALKAAMQTRVLKSEDHPFLRGAASWHDLANQIANDFEEAMGSTNSNLRLGRRSEGPVSRFLAAVFPNVTEQTPSSASIANWFKSPNPSKGDRRQAGARRKRKRRAALPAGIGPG
jgi:hypothetical protein